MSRRDRLRKAVTYMLMALGAGFLFVLFKSTTSMAPSASDDDLPALAPGQTALVRWAGQRVWVTRLSVELRRQLRERVSPHVVSQEGCEMTSEYCRILAGTARQGVELRYLPNKPAVLQAEQIWVGGFVDPNTGAAYDLLGRAYRQPAQAVALIIMSAED